MASEPAIRLAVDLLHLPARIRRTRLQPLPDGVSTLLVIAAGDEQAAVDAAEAIGRSSLLVRRAAAFFIEQILLSSDADSYRVLGADRRASTQELRRNLALLLRWLHPDVAHHDDRSIFAARVTAAWEDLKTTDRRIAYDQGQRRNKAGWRFHRRSAAKPGYRDIFGNWRRGKSLIEQALGLLLHSSRR